MHYSIPYIVEKDGSSEKIKDIFTRLLEDRIVFVSGPVNEAMAQAVTAQLLYLSADDPAADIQMYISSPGGSVVSGLAIFDTMNYVAPEVATTCIGQASSMGAFLLASGAKGKRRATENSRIMIHQPLSSASGQITDMEIALKEGLRYKKVLTDYLARFTGQPVEKVTEDCERDFFMSPDEAKEYGLIDDILKK
jgi:ATP-dependent Clp protease protease subunit